jgi:hypothetical protein
MSKQKALEELDRALGYILEEKLSEEDKGRIVEDAIENYNTYVNPGWLKYRKSVSTNEAFVEWMDHDSYFYDVYGEEFIDCLGGFGIYMCGHRNPEILKAVEAHLKRQALHSQELLDPLRGYLNGLFNGMEKKWWVDEIYQAIVVGPYVALAAFLADVIDWRFWHDWFHDKVIAGGYPGAERVMAAFSGENAEAQFPIECLTVRWNKKFGDAGHRDVLGAVMGLRIEREAMGDIVIGDGEAYLFAEREIARYIRENLSSAGRARVTVETRAEKIAAPEPEGAGASRAMVEAVERGGLSASDIVHINAHATSTPVGDIAESNAIRRAFGDAADGMPVSATKSMTGHLLGAAGALEGVLTILALHHRTAPATINLESPDPQIQLDVISGTARTLPDGDIAALNNSFGFGGHNVALTFKSV